MKIVVFICLLSVSWCLSLPTDQQGPALPPAAKLPASNNPVAATGSNAAASPPVTPTTAPTASVTLPDQKADKTTEIPVKDTKSEVPIVQKNQTIISTNTSQAVTPANDAAANANKDGNKTNPNKKDEEHKKENKDVPASIAPTGNLTPADKPTNGSKVPEEGSTTKPTVTVKPSEDSKTPPHTIEAARGFDGASFIGGIILTLGLLAIGFMGFKYYRNQTERNYHTL